MKHNSDPILDLSSCSDHSNLAEDLSSHSGGFLTPNSLVEVLFFFLQAGALDHMVMYNMHAFGWIQ